jgi:DNA-3-methyladenine glycosylase
MRPCSAPPGTLYVYLIYGFYYCMNVVTGPEGVGEAILIRALEPTEGIDLMAERRNLDPTTKAGLRGLTSGPGKLVIAMGISREHNFLSLTGSKITSPVFIRPRVFGRS